MTTKIISHRRSGTHFLWETMRLNFDIESENMRDPNIFKTHIPYSEKYFESIKDQDLIYIVRDGRDTIVANYHYWRRFGEHEANCYSKIIRRPFTEYLNGNCYVPTCLNPYISDSFKNPVKHWAAHTEWANHVFFVRFEDLKKDATSVMKSISDRFGYKFKNNKVMEVRRPVGHYPRKGLIGDWRNHFSRNDLDYFWSIAGDRMDELDYLKDVEI